MTGRSRRIGVVRRGPGSGSARVRIDALVPTWRDAGHRVRSLDWHVAGRRSMVARSLALLRLARWADVVVVQKPTQPTWLLRLVERLAPVVLDVDDAVWVGSRGAVTAASRRIGDRLAAAAARGDVVVVGSRWLGEQVRAMSPGARVEVLGSSTVVPDAAPVPPPPPPLRLVWTGSGGNLRDLERAFVDGVRSLLEEGTATLTVVCDRAPDLGVPVEHVPWSERAEAEVLATCHVGLMPLVDDDRSRGRCSYKAVRHLALGQPVVASPVGGAVEVVRDGDTGLHATDAEGWERALRSLADDPSLRERLGAAGRAHVRAHHDREAAARWWLDLLAEVGW